MTTVIRQQVQALQGACELLAVTGTSPESGFPADTVSIPGLAYDPESGIRPDPLETADAVWNAIHSKWPSGCDVLHVHNPTLAKNKNFLKVLKALQGKGVRLFLQIHDFAEDGRPGAYFPESYPENCHYGVINSRDYRILTGAGLKSVGLHLLPNTVPPLPVDSKLSADDHRHVLYPIRAIRRKNIGEAILLSELFEDRLPLCITLPPSSPADFPGYEFWKGWTARKKLAVAFDAGLREDFADLVRYSRFMITTSITEGFGFSFLEPWTAGKYLWGRKLPDICDDFEKNGIRLDHLYPRIDIPLDWMDEAAFRKAWESCFNTVCQHFDAVSDHGHAVKGYEHITRKRRIDLGLLSEPFQGQVLTAILGQEAAKAKLLYMNPQLRLPEHTPEDQTLISRNSEAVHRRYNMEVYRANLIGIYKKVSTAPVTHSIDKPSLLRAFLRPGNFSLLKWHI